MPESRKKERSQRTTPDSNKSGKAEQPRTTPERPSQSTYDKKRGPPDKAHPRDV